MGLRERQKANRRERILEVAKARFQTDGYAPTTIEMIAKDADVSAVTVYNYFDTKAGLLLALVGESDQLLIRQLKTMIAREPTDIIDAVATFGQILRRHAMRYLEKSTWREVLSASIQEGSSDFGRTYLELDRILIELMRAMILAFQKRGLIAESVDSEALADCLFSLQNIRFFQFIADDNSDDAEIDRRLRSDLTALKGLFSAQ
ncbi:MULTISPECIES: TetR/AcrR family transcriptional regulator [unclassified Shinella]|uniref:TetR/AcrR family transcriptional regulator n=1 Tax=unclassified Shinella TaxID=2643062 RepID=UPI00234F8C34|nr:MULTISPECIES: TetR/AcrR family transcriptional regulator [unclassified Shinella]MCO5152053.1 TetR/AcrR family transcriptional regulator [Shinella sp.]